MTIRTYHILFVYFCVILAANGQIEKSISLKNPSFEGVPHDARNPEGWSSCGVGSTPDILPGPWGVYQKPTEGNTYLGLITREKNDWEAIEQRLKVPLKKHSCYTFQVDLALSPSYAGYSKPVVFRVWAGLTSCSRDKLIAQSPRIDHIEWKTYDFMFATEQNSYKYIIIEAYYAQPTLTYYRGNILVDNISVFKPCDRA